VSFTQEEFMRWWDLTCAAFKTAEMGDIDEAMSLYEQADRSTSHAKTPSALSILRHIPGELTVPQRIVSFPFNEDVVAMGALNIGEESDDARGMSPIKFSSERIRQNILGYLGNCTLGYHHNNIKKQMPHLMVIGTGRCGSVSLHRLLERSQYMSYHAYVLTVPNEVNTEYAACLCAGYHNDRVPKVWAKVRAAEWIGAISYDRPVAFMSHRDTVFAPVFAALHTQSKFIHLRRNPFDVFKSYVSKQQWGGAGRAQICPFNYRINGGFFFRMQNLDVPHEVAWYIRFTDDFCAAMGDVVGPERFLEVSSDKLFAQDKEEIERLKDFTECEIPLDEMIAHFAHKYNEKAHKDTGADLTKSIKIFEQAYESL